MIDKGSTLSLNSQIGDEIAEASKNLPIIDIQTENRLAGATIEAAKNTELTLNHAIWMKREGYSENTISRRIKMLTVLSKRGANFLDCDSVKDVISKQKTWSLKTKEIACETYSCFLKMTGGSWKQPKYRAPTTLPFIPTETEVNQLIAGTNKKTAAFL